MKRALRISAMLIAASITIACESKADPDNGKQPDNDKGTETEVIPTVKTQIYKQNSEYHTFRIPALVTTKKGTLLCFCEGRSSYDDFGDIDMVVKRSEDYGKTWSPLQVIADAGNDRYGNPVPVVLDNGRILLVFGWSVNTSSSSSKVFCVHSDDDGKTWSSPREITSMVKISTRSRYQTGPVHGIVKQLAPNKGRIIIPVYGTVSNNMPAAILYSDDNGASWAHGGSVDTQYGGEPTVAELGDGSIMINMRNRNHSNNTYRIQSISKDGGMTWGQVTNTELIEPDCQGALLTYDLGSGPGNTVLLFSNPNHTSSRRHGSVKMSTNGGKSWRYMYQYTTDTGDDMYSSYSDLAIVKNDVIGIAFEHGNTNRQGIYFKSIKKDEIKEPYTGQNKN